jgi:hypothetical protein
LTSDQPDVTFPENNHSQEKDIHVSDGIGTRNPSKQTAGEFNRYYVISQGGADVKVAKKKTCSASVGYQISVIDSAGLSLY